MKKLNFKSFARAIPSMMQEHLKNRFRKVSNDEIIRWVDNTHTAFGQNIQELRKSLSRDDPQQAWVYMEDIRKGATTLLAAMDIIEERLQN